MNFLDIYKKIRSIDEAGPVPPPTTPQAPPAPYGGSPQTHGPVNLPFMTAQPAKGTPAQMAAAEQVYAAAIRAGKTNAEAEAAEQAALTGVSHNLDGTPKVAAPAPAAAAPAAAAPADPNSVTNPSPEQLAAWANGQNPPTTWNKNPTTRKYEPPTAAPTTNGPVTHGPLKFGQQPAQQPAQMEATPTKPNNGLSWNEMSPEQQQAFTAKQQADRAAAVTPVPAGLSWNEMSPEQQQVFVAKQKADRAASALGLNECGDMMPQSPAQQDNVDMNVTLHGSGPGGIRDLMSILRDIEGKDSNGGMTVEPHAGDIEVMLGDMEEEYGNSVRGASGPHTASIQAVTNVGTPTNGGDHKPRQAGLPQANAHPMHETVKSKLQQQYDAIKQEGAFDDIADTKLGDMPGKLATGAKRAYDNAATKVGKVATAVGNTTPREVGQKIGQGIDNLSQKAITAMKSTVSPTASGQPAGNPSEQTGMRESTDFARVKQLNKILNG